VKAENLSAVVYASANPERLAAFYREHLGLDFVHQAHGPIRDHLETWFGQMHFAILKGSGRGSPVSPTFRVKGLETFITQLEAAGAKALSQIADLGEGKRLVSFRDPDGNMFNLLDLGPSVP
jgi:catechol 2,3-dioxygenase-like lactoylglutathione lyase family enzyme